MGNAIETMDALEIRDALPHRYPFLLIDRISGGVVGESITAVKNVSNNEPFFQGHKHWFKSGLRQQRR